MIKAKDLKKERKKKKKNRCRATNELQPINAREGSLWERVKEPYGDAEDEIGR